jgi:hypothetical protein
MSQKMKQLLLPIIVAVLTTPAQAAMIKAVATDVLMDYTHGDFSLTTGGTALDESGIEATLSENHASLVSTKTADPIFGLSNTSDAGDYVVMSIGFDSSNVVTGSGADLVIFSKWAGSSYEFGLQAFDNSNTLLSSYNYTVDGSLLFSSGIAVTSIDLFNNNNPATMLADGIEIGYLSVFLGNDYNGANLNAYSNIALAGAYHVAPVPIPLPLILFASGLSLLGWIGRRKHS